MFSEVQNLPIPSVDLQIKKVITFYSLHNSCPYILEVEDFVVFSPCLSKNETTRDISKVLTVAQVVSLYIVYVA